MTDRIPLDNLTSDQYDELCDQLEALRQVARDYCPACGRGDAAPTVEDWEQQKQRAETAENRLRLAHQARRAKEHQLDGIRRALCDIGAIQDGDPYSHADLEDVIRQLGSIDEQPGPTATEATEPARWLFAGTRDLSIPDTTKEN